MKQYSSRIDNGTLPWPGVLGTVQALTVGQKGGLYQINSEVHISDQFRTIWDQLGPFGTIWDHLGPFGTIWDHLGPFGTIWVHLGPFGRGV